MDGANARFADRAEAGRELARRLAAMRLERPIVYALPRGGVPVGLEVAEALKAPLEVLIVRKIGAPGSPELALAAVVDGSGTAQTIVNEDVRALTGASDAFLEAGRAAALQEIERRRKVYLGRHHRLDPTGRTAIVVDDGLATGASAKAALAALKAQGAAAKRILAVPVAPRETVAEFEAFADQVVCLEPSDMFFGVGQFYRDFHQLTDDETVALLRRAWGDDSACG